MTQTSTHFYFGIPLRSKASSSNWQNVCRLLEYTIKSTLNQTNQQFAALIAGQDEPDTDVLNNSKVTFLKVPFGEPARAEEYWKDQRRKRRLLLAELKARGGGYLMFLDADDLVSKKLVEFVLRDNNRVGYTITDGFTFGLETRRLRSINTSFHQMCGSSCILFFTTTELPDTYNDDNRYLCDEFEHHQTFREDALRLGRPLGNVPFRAAIYIRQTGDNQSVKRGLVPPTSRLKAIIGPLVSQFLNSHELEKEVTRDFGINLKTMGMRSVFKPKVNC